MSLELIEDLGSLYPTEKSNYKKRFGLYRCACGNEFKAMVSSVKNGNTKSCGCYRVNSVINRNTTHGLTNHPIYNTWCRMIDRTTNVKSKDYKYYIDRGISICDEWRNDFISFYNWALDNNYKEGLSIDRINNDGNYEPSNCRWATREVQSRNTQKLRSTNTSGYRGVSFDKKRNKWVSLITVNKKSYYLGLFDNKFDAALSFDKYIIDNNLEHTLNF